MLIDYVAPPRRFSAPPSFLMRAVFLSPAHGSKENCVFAMEDIARCAILARRLIDSAARAHAARAAPFAHARKAVSALFARAGAYAYAAKMPCSFKQNMRGHRVSDIVYDTQLV